MRRSQLPYLILIVVGLVGALLTLVAPADAAPASRASTPPDLTSRKRLAGHPLHLGAPRMRTLPIPQAAPAVGVRRVLSMSA